MYSNFYALFMLCFVFMKQTEQTISKDHTEIRPIKLQYKQDVSLDCNGIESETNINKSDDDSNQEKILWKNVNFYKTTPSTSVNVTFFKIEPDNRKYSIDPINNILNITDLRREDIESTYLCNSSSSNRAIAFYPLILPFLFVPDQETVTVTEGNDAELMCKLLYGFEGNQNVTWEWEEDGKDIDSFSDNINYEITYNATIHQSILKLKAVTQVRRGVYTCRATNAYGSHSREIRLRVKDFWVWVWPCIGIVIQLVIVLIIIYFSEKRKKIKQLKRDQEYSNERRKLTNPN